MKKSILFLNGPNLHRLGARKPELYGFLSMGEIINSIEMKYPNIEFYYEQSNHEGELIDILWEEKWDAIVFNPGGLCHYSVCLRDAVEGISTPVVEVHLTNIREREYFRKESLLSHVCVGTFMGDGHKSYEKAVDYIVEEIFRHASK